MILKYFQIIDEAISYLFSSVTNERKLLKSIFKKKSIYYIDIGTNEGSYLDFLQRNFKFKKVVCFEPIDDLVINLNKKFKNKNIEINNFALSNKKKNNVKFYQYKI